MNFRKISDKDPAIIYREFKDNVFNDITNKDLFSDSIEWMVHMLH
ncbi:hypothetical protein NWE61_06800 [Mycoplasmopsis felis]|nr:hypothetical protein [Mycoplasmopsis felis]MCU9934753.1 hypothetical protein [Mycoplasmopsis felis]